MVQAQVQVHGLLYVKGLEVCVVHHKQRIKAIAVFTIPTSLAFILTMEYHGQQIVLPKIKMKTYCFGLFYSPTIKNSKYKEEGENADL